MNHMTTFYKTEAVKLVGGYPNIYEKIMVYGQIILPLIKILLI